MKDKKNAADIPVPGICRGCYRWEQWKHKCSYYWKDKRECGSKVSGHEEMIFLDQLRRR